MTRLADLPPFCLEYPPHLTYGLALGLDGLPPGQRVIARGICLSEDSLTLHYAVFPATPAARRADARGFSLNVFYDADVSPPDGNYAGGQGPADGGIVVGKRSFSRPPADAQYAWFDFFAPGYDIDSHMGRRGNPDQDYLAHRVSRLTFDLVTGRAELAPGPGTA
jgi:hypothetical protein